MTAFDLTAALEALPQSEVEVSVWSTSSDSDGLQDGTWGPWVALAGPVVISWNHDDQRIIRDAAGQEYLLSMTIYCPRSLPIGDIERILPLGRSARVRVSTHSEIFRVITCRSWAHTADHAEVRCSLEVRGS